VEPPIRYNSTAWALSQQTTVDSASTELIKDDENGIETSIKTRTNCVIRLMNLSNTDLPITHAS